MERNFKRLHGDYKDYEILTDDSDIFIEPRTQLGKGGFGRVFEVSYDDGKYPRVNRLAVLKFLSLDRASDDIAKADFAAETEIVKKLNIGSVPHFLSAGSLSIRKIGASDTGMSVPYYLVERILNTATLADIIENQDGSKIDIDFLLDLTEAAIRGYGELQRCRILHLDLHPKNVLVALEMHEENGVSKRECIGVYFIDFGKAREIPLPAAGEQPDISPNRAPGDLHREYLHPDLARMFDTKKFHSKEFNTPRAYRFDMFALATCLIVLWKGTRVGADRNLARASDTVLQTLELTRNAGASVEFPLEKTLNKITWYKFKDRTETPTLIRLAGGSSVQVHEKYMALIRTPEFQRLRNIQQLGLTHLVYPSATHTRFSHSIGVFHVAQRYWEALLQNSPYALNRFDDEIKQRFLAHALLHDVGHYPFAHYFEECLEKELVTLNGTTKERKILKFDKAFLLFPLSHEELGRRLLAGEIAFGGADAGKKLGGPVMNNKNSLHNVFKKYFDRDPLESYDDIFKLQVVSEMLSGSMDCDKVDYLGRDGMACGVPYAQGIDLDRLLSGLVITTDPGNRELFRLAVSEKGLAPLESILSARYHLFSEVYWHKVCRSTAAMLKWALIRTIEAGKLSEGEFIHAAINLGDVGFLEYLHSKLVEIDPDAAQELLANLSTDRKFYKRLVTFSRAWSLRDNDPFKKIIDSTENGKSSKVRMVQTMIREKLEAVYGMRIAPHRLLLDVPPFTEDKEGKTPLVIFEEGKKQTKTVYEVSGIHHAPGNDRTLTPLYYTQRIRLFASDALLCDMKDHGIDVDDQSKLRQLFEGIVTELL